MELKVYSIDGNDTGRTVIVDDALFGTEPNDHVLWLAVKQFLANQRQGTHKSKERSEVSGSTKKLKRQKGTGGARAGDTNSPTIVGGGRAFGPRPRDYRFKLNKKVKRLARLSALYYKSKEDNVLVVEDFSFDMPKTKNMVKVLSALKLQDKKTLFVVNTDPKNFVTLSARNIANVKVMNAASVNAYEVLNAKKLVFSETAIVELDKMCANS
ncbi:MAG: 50S ribosomal protein L4 [Bacteroidales bacterium]|jgi:large subunit ribosomal protein L4|nr:50S ribosomal protein L4 [Bacteroidales bacterium]MBO7229128.1 50S ribosomal protein L4 [Bacteroidales bacterium]MBQ1190722.1 50S ribosomal protein L4 [Bacteroidales bacterium]MBQ2304353.1 50S ribosomal protein L4 [Bacteroidales bacterium]MBQ2386708.1 50S ribosomal protein L4 [Bacteroidales bacterium]